MQTDGHCRLSPSRAHLWMHCPHSAYAPPPPETDAMTRGTAMHIATHDIATYTQLPPDQRDNVDGYNAAITRLCNQIGGAIAQREALLSMDDNAIYGTADCVIANNRYVIIIDYKTGGAPVALRGNPQLMTYMAIYCQSTIIDDGDYGDGARRRMIGVYQYNRLRLANVSIPDLRGWYNNVMLTAIRDNTNCPDRRNRGAWCKTCTLRDQCAKPGADYDRITTMTAIDVIRRHRDGQHMRDISVSTGVAYTTVRNIINGAGQYGGYLQAAAANYARPI